MRKIVVGALRARPIVLALLVSALPLAADASAPGSAAAVAPSGSAAAPSSLGEMDRVVGAFRIGFGSEVPKTPDVDRKAERPIRDRPPLADEARNLYRSGDNDAALALLSEERLRDEIGRASCRERV